MNVEEEPPYEPEIGDACLNEREFHILLTIISVFTHINQNNSTHIKQHEVRMPEGLNPVKNGRQTKRRHLGASVPASILTRLNSSGVAFLKGFTLCCFHLLNGDFSRISRYQVIFLSLTFAVQMYLLHLVDMCDYLTDATPVSAATSLPVPGNANGKGGNFTSWTYRQREMNA